MKTILTNEQLFDFAKTLKVLYVEDDEDAREITECLLESYMGKVIVGKDGEDGYEKFDSSFDLVITDINMPKMNGIEMLKKIKEKNDQVDMMVISAHNDSRYYTQTIELGVDGYMLKPISQSNFNAALLKVLEKIYLKKELINHKLYLEKKVSEQIEQLREKDQALLQQSKLAAMGEIMDVVAHQWKQPLTLMSLKTNFLSEYSDNDMIPLKDIRKCNDDVTRQIKHLVSTIDEFRKFLRPNTNMSSCNLSQVFDTVKLLLKDDMIKHNIDLSIMAPEDIAINANENEIKHLFINFLSNSKDAFVSNKIENRKIEICAQEELNDVSITVQDNAGGIKSEYIEQIFDAHFTTKNFSGGTGIGLYMAKMIVDKYNGSITAKNQNDGVCFTIKFKRKSNE